MKNAIIVHGWASLGEFNNKDFPTPSNAHWIPWLSKELMIKDIHTVAVEMPKADLPVYNDWKKEFERFDVTTETVLVGHSCGAGFLVRWLSENPNINLNKLMLVGPSLGLSWDDRSFFDFEIDPKISERVEKIVIIVADNDKQAILDATEIYAKKLSTAKVLRMKQGGHFTYKDMGKHESPELLEELL